MSTEKQESVCPVLNTTEFVKENPHHARIEAAVLGSEGYVLSQERAGVEGLLCGTVIPTNGSGGPGWEAIGIKLGAPFPSDDLFRPATLPAGWKVVRGEDRTLYVVDDKGRKRVFIWYKAAFYDRYARTRLICRFSIRRNYDLPGRVLSTRAVVEVRDGDTLVMRKVAAVPDKRIKEREYYAQIEEVEQRLIKECREWLESQFPDWTKPEAYWDAAPLPAIKDVPVTTDAPAMYRIICPYRDEQDVKESCLLVVLEDDQEVYRVKKPYAQKECWCWHDGDGYVESRRSKGTDKRDCERVLRECEKACKDWLDQNRPGWKKHSIR